MATQFGCKSVWRMNLSYECVYKEDELTLHVGSECMGFFGLVRSRRDADTCTHALLLDSGFSAFLHCGLRANIDTRTQLHASTAHVQWEGLQWLQLPGKVVGLL